MNQMQRLGYWASGNRGLAQGMIVLCYLMIAVLGIVLACFIPKEQSPTVAGLMLAGTVAITIMAAFFYPNVGRNRRSRRICDLALIGATLLFNIGNTPRQLDHTAPLQEVFAATRDADTKNVVHSEIKEHGYYHRLVSRLQKLRAWYPRQSTGLKILIVFCVVVVAAAIAVVWAGLCCSIACSGAEAIAAVLFILGIGGLIWGSILLIQRYLHIGRWRSRAVRS